MNNQKKKNFSPFLLSVSSSYCVCVYCVGRASAAITLYREFILNGSIFFLSVVAFHENYTVAKVVPPGVMECPYYFRFFFFSRRAAVYIMSVVITYVFLLPNGIRVKFVSSFLLFFFVSYPSSPWSCFFLSLLIFQ